jgi:hypothetical protein
VIAIHREDNHGTKYQSPSQTEVQTGGHSPSRTLRDCQRTRTRSRRQRGVGTQYFSIGRASDARLGQRRRQLFRADTARCCDEFRYDAAIDYKADNLDSALAAACPEGVDIYYDNTAGTISDAVLKHLRVGARVVICGTASIANWEPIPEGPRVERHLLVKRARMQGFIIFDYAERFTEALQEITQWVRQGMIRYREDILEGIEQAPGSIAGLYRGENFGKRLIRIAPQE